MRCRPFLRIIVVIVLTLCPAMLWASPQVRHPQVTQIPAVAVSTATDDADAPNLAWIESTAGATTLMLASLTGKNAHAVAIPGGCVEVGLRWANGGYPLPRTEVWHELAVMTHCGRDGAPMHSVIWVVDARHANKPPREVVDLAGYAHCMQWTAQDKGIAFLYMPGILSPPHVPAAENCLSHHLDRLSASANDVQRVEMVSIANGKTEMVTPANMDVYEFAWTFYGPQALLYVATQPGDSRWAAKLYRKWGNTTPAQWVVVDPATSPQLRGQHISMPSWGWDRPVVYFLGIKNAKNAAAGNWYRVQSGGGTPVNLTADTNLKPSWVNRFGIGTRRVGNTTEILSIPRWFARPYEPTKVLFSINGTVSDGRAPLSISALGGGLAFMVSSPDSAPEVYATRRGPPRQVTSLNNCVGACINHR